ncbi:MAG: hypothetical protein P8X69_06400 [Maritimibacter sp.]
MRKFTQLSFAAGVSLALAAPGFAEPGNVLYDLIDNSFGYTSIGENTVLIQGEMNPELCHLSGSDAYFDAVLAGDEAATTAAQPNATCVPLSIFEVIATGSSIDSIFDLATAVDEAEGYFVPTPGTLLLEGYDQIDLCRFTLPDAYFDAVMAGEEPDEGSRPSVICLPLNEVFQ